MSEADLYKLFSQYDGEADLSDFTPEELENLLGERKKSEKEKYFEYYDDVKSKSLKKQDWGAKCPHRRAAPFFMRQCRSLPGQTSAFGAIRRGRRS